MDQPNIIPRAEAEYLLGANRTSFDRFVQRHGLRAIKLAGGEVFRRSQFLEAVERALAAVEAASDEGRVA